MSFTNDTLGGASVYLIACRIVDMYSEWRSLDKQSIYVKTMLDDLISQDIDAVKFFCDIFTDSVLKQPYTEIFVYGPKNWEEKEPWNSQLDQINSLPLLARTFSNRLHWAKTQLFNKGQGEDPKDVLYKNRSSDALTTFAHDIFDVWCHCDDSFVARIKNSHEKSIVLVKQEIVLRAAEEKKAEEKKAEQKRADTPKKIFPPFVPGRAIPDVENPWKIRQAETEVKNLEKTQLDNKDDHENTSNVESGDGEENVTNADSNVEESNSTDTDASFEVNDANWKTFTKKKTLQTAFVQFVFAGKTHRVECVVLPSGDYTPFVQKTNDKPKFVKKPFTNVKNAHKQ